MFKVLYTVYVIDYYENSVKVRSVVLFSLGLYVICYHVMLLLARDVPDFTFPNPAGAGFGQIYELKSGRGRSRSRI